MRPLFVLAFLAALLSSPASAQPTGEKLVVAKCDGGGCVCTLTALTADDLVFLLGPDIPANAVSMTYVSIGGKSYLSPLSPDQVHQAAGGIGRCEIALFDPIQPLDGVWTGTVQVQAVTGCPPQVDEMVRPVLVGMVMQRRVAWGGRYDPAKLSVGDSSALVRWSERSPGQFVGHLQLEANPVLSVTGALTSTLLTPERATASMQIRIAAANGANASALAMLGMADCRTTAVYDFVRTGS